MSERLKRGESLFKAASDIINGDRQDQYGDPEDSFETIGVLWAMYLERIVGNFRVEISPQNVAMMMVLFKIVREWNQFKPDNVIDWTGYSGIYFDMMSQEEK